MAVCVLMSAVCVIIYVGEFGYNNTVIITFNQSPKLGVNSAFISL